MTSQTFILHPDRADIRQNCHDFIRGLDSGKAWRVIVGEYVAKKKRSPEANAFYFACVVTPLAEHCGYTKAEMHDEILGAYFGWEKRAVRGHVREFPRRRTTSPDTMEKLDFMGLTQLGQQIAAELGVTLPDQQNE